ncbi:hypothetical protein [Gluconacetobacter takamatsuzukensis]|uniref:Uncharacterized protein n=1 Tax=Gluconacetobacter takamatsuzukensis TaxID=1286190 RepID=A0A7W4PP63_9PROT|nr:hypothetical protein [Gluconacetobacter takamatsuzukensis]MBB2204863.1 hypothetical protein [Gluconacetobacter takamatsuzukensis]
MARKPVRRQKASDTQFSGTKKGRLLALMDKLSGGEGEAFLSRLHDGPETVEALAAEIASGPSVEILSKLARTNTGGIDWVTQADYEYVGLPPDASRCDFRTGFETYLRGRLGKRADGFAAIFDALDPHANPLIIETGCLRVPGNWEGDGQSTFQFDWYVRERQGRVVTIDVNERSIDSARRACSSATSTILNDSVAALDMLGAIAGEPAALIYLDSFDLDIANPMPSAIHHAMEVMAARRLIGSGTIVCIDDFDVAPLGLGGKGLIVNQFLTTIGATVLYCGYQKVWRVTS